MVKKDDTTLIVKRQFFFRVTVSRKVQKFTIIIITIIIVLKILIIIIVLMINNTACTPVCPATLFNLTATPTMQQFFVTSCGMVYLATINHWGQGDAVVVTVVDAVVVAGVTTGRGYLNGRPRLHTNNQKVGMQVSKRIRFLLSIQSTNKNDAKTAPR